MISNSFFGFMKESSSGGGGSSTIFSDGQTIIGDGSVGDPIYITNSLESEIINDTSIIITQNGGGKVYIIQGANNEFEFNPNNILDNQVVRLVNQQETTLFLSSDGVLVKYQGSNLDILNIPKGMVYDFIYNQSQNTWFCLAPTPMPTFLIDLSSFGYDIVNNGFYVFTNSSGLDNGISLPNPSIFRGQTIYIINRSVYPISLVGSYFPFVADGSDFYSIGANSSVELISNGTWYQVSQLIV